MKHLRAGSAARSVPELKQPLANAEEYASFASSLARRHSLPLSKLGILDPVCN
jgi:hypothetical protein